ncbi:M28 family peptidase [Acaryochloris sp. IP29b_bin.148]|uniref:M28 family peptidase n=1 Tax=Acaryochloris sp. IP29b_bin.148 TaxID=2969218 RepID=UPI002608C92E|nr:M28 family peptidase [Acaryochloris sp. IP29b_bin.148]
MEVLQGPHSTYLFYDFDLGGQTLDENCLTAAGGISGVRQWLGFSPEKMFKSRKVWILGAIACLFVLFLSCQSPRPVAQTPSTAPSPESAASPPTSSSPTVSPVAPPSVASAPPPIVSGKRLIADLKALNFERYTAAELQQTRAFITQTLTAAGWTVSEQPFETGVNVVAERPGTDPNAGALLVGAHYDSVRGSPGADDNATGVVVALEVARLLGDRQTLRPLRIVLFDQEEAGLVGSYAYAQRPENLKNLDGVVILEMLGYTCSRPGCQYKPVEFKVELPSDQGDFLAIAGDTEHLPLLNAFSENHQPNLPALVPVSIPFKGLLTPVILRSDHTPFWFEGIGAVMLTDTAHLRNPHYHRRTDTPDSLDAAFLEGNAQTAVNAITALLDRPQSFLTSATDKS